MLRVLLITAIPLATIALLYARWEYRKQGQLSLLGLALLCAMLFVPNLMLEYATSYQLPRSPLNYAGTVIALFGLAVLLISIVSFHSMKKVLCVDPGKLATTGPYRWSRNPQYVGWFLFQLGFALNDWSLWCLAALLISGISLHLLVLVEEEHLHRTFGEQYAEFCRSIPRYAGWGRAKALTCQA